MFNLNVLNNRYTVLNQSLNICRVTTGLMIHSYAPHMNHSQKTQLLPNKVATKSTHTWRLAPDSLPPLELQRRVFSESSSEWDVKIAISRCGIPPPPFRPVFDIRAIDKFHLHARSMKSRCYPVFVIELHERNTGRTKIRTARRRMT